ncbi:MAG: hypothetical protein II953_04780, partial [Clostridia bacterium]|nr:hypothetical protein [Clostridia bacterium]
NIIPIDCTLSPFHARLNHRRKAAGFILRMFQLYDRRSSAVGSMFRLVPFESEKLREDRPILRRNDRAFPESQRSAPI